MEWQNGSTKRDPVLSPCRDREQGRVHRCRIAPPNPANSHVNPAEPVVRPDRPHSAQPHFHVIVGTITRSCSTDARSASFFGFSGFPEPDFRAAAGWLRICFKPNNG